MRLATPRTPLAPLLGALLAVLAASSADASLVTNLSATFLNGQTYLSWTCPPGTGWIYHVYASNSPITSSADLYSWRILTTVADSTWYDSRLSVLTGATYAYRVPGAAAPLAPGSGLAVITVTNTQPVYYAVTETPISTFVEDVTVDVGGNSLRRPVREQLGTPAPAWQRTLTWGGITTDLYTLWTSNVPTPYFPAMANVPGLAFDCALTRPAASTQSSLMIRPHPKGGDFLQSLQGTGTPGEWVLALDDPLPNADGNTFWYGYHEDYVVTSDGNVPPVMGTVQDYTLRRIEHTVLWARNTFGIDPTRVYAYGYSMGGIGSVLLAFHRPDIIAAIMTIVGKFDFSFLNDPNPASGFNTGNPLRDLTNRLWGDVSTDLPTSDGEPIYTQLNDGLLAGAIEPVAVPPIVAFNGRNDTVVGWAEKIPFYGAMRAFHQGGTFFWDTRDHIGSATAAWSPMQDVKYLYRFRTNLSFPGLSNCSADGNPGDGTVTAGDSVGTINGYVVWDTTLVDLVDRWECTLRTRDLTERWGPAPAPTLVTVDVTPRRLQAFKVVQGTQYAYTVTRLSDGSTVLSGVFSPDSLSLLTVPQVPVDGGGSRLSIVPLGAAAVTGATGARLQLALSTNPVRPGSSIQLVWPAAGRGRVEILDVSGRSVRTLVDGPVAAGYSRLAFPTAGVAPGVYFVTARQGEQASTRRAIVLR